MDCWWGLQRHNSGLEEIHDETVLIFLLQLFKQRITFQHVHERQANLERYSYRVNKTKLKSKFKQTSKYKWPEYWILVIWLQYVRIIVARADRQMREESDSPSSPSRWHKSDVSCLTDPHDVDEHERDHTHTQEIKAIMCFVSLFTAQTCFLFRKSDSSVDHRNFPTESSLNLWCCKWLQGSFQFSCFIPNATEQWRRS